MALTTPLTLTALSATLLFNSFSANADPVSCPNAEVGSVFIENQRLYMVADDRIVGQQDKINALQQGYLYFCTSQVTDMSNLFQGNSTFNADISDWDTSNVTNMANMFQNASAFNQNISDWDTSNVTNMANMFQNASVFNQNISAWNTSNVTDMTDMFLGADAFSYDTSSWHQSTVSCLDKGVGERFRYKNMEYLVVDDTSIRLPENQDALVNDDLRFCTSHVTDMAYLFSRDFEPAYKDFNADISDWDTSQVTNMQGLFIKTTAFNQPIGNWDTSKVTNMRLMFFRAYAFNQPIGEWDTAEVTDMRSMFSQNTTFNQPIGNWDTAKVTNMSQMFDSNRSFNQPIGDW
ncbi:BspA family leucine-rich repeat surface protein, partial [Vibrio chagasii]|uniref:BspA family leucine-rich repeat surface protein n=1 Tax=Vibrio chagasii TaxID=170679 RepID=UPI00354FB15A